MANLETKQIQLGSSEAIIISNKNMAGHSTENNVLIGKG